MAIENLKRHLILVRLIFNITLWLKIKADLKCGVPKNTQVKKSHPIYCKQKA
jgi:hypothetical protein